MNNIPSNKLVSFVEEAATTVTNVKFSNENIEAAIQWQNDANIRMVYPCEDIDAAYYAYLDQPISLRFDADNKCTELFGMNCEELYKFLKNCDATATFIDREDDYSLSTKLDNTFDGICTDFKDLQPLKAKYPILVTEFGIFTLVISVQL